MKRHEAAIVGAGPSGFYSAAALLRAGFNVDLYDSLLTPFGLVRSGVAPDHPKIKSVTRVFEKIAEHESFRFFGGVRIGDDVTLAELRERYHAVLYAVGAPSDNRLGIPGEEAPGSYSATDFVAWYNGHPEHAEHHFNLSAERAVVIGHGNVALDVARMLVLGQEELRVTDTADHAIDRLGRSSVREVVVLGRRGPAQAAFTTPELRELGELRTADVVVDSDEMTLDPLSANWLASDAADGASRRNVEVLRGYAGRKPQSSPHRIVLRFLRSPTEMLLSEDGSVCGLRITHNRVERRPDGTLGAVSTGDVETIPCGFVVRSIGYRGRPLPGVPFDARRGIIPNDGGRVIDEAGRQRCGEYVVGWIKRGPTGVIGTNKKDATETVERIREDRDFGRLAAAAAADRAGVLDWLRGRVGHVGTWHGWQAIDAHERGLGEALGRPRVKLIRIPEMIRICDSRDAI